MDEKAKVWGGTQELFFKNNVELHRIKVNIGACCSKHKHEHKFNAFYIEKGKLKISAWEGEIPVETTICERQTLVIRPGLYHMFEALENTVAFEIYWTEICGDDIVRET